MLTKTGFIRPVFCIVRFCYRFRSRTSSAFPAARKKNEATKSTMKITKRIFAIPADADAIPPNPKIPAMIASTKNVSAQDNIVNIVMNKCL